MKKKRAQLEKAIRKALQPYKPEKIYLFGSWARGDENEELTSSKIPAS